MLNIGEYLLYINVLYMQSQFDGEEDMSAFIGLSSARNDDSGRGRPFGNL